MKKVILYITILSAALAGCQKHSVDLIQGQTVDERLRAAYAQYTSILTKAQYGWKLVETGGTAFNNGAYDSAKATFVYHLQFNDSNTVTMFGSFDTVQAKTPRTSGYRLSAQQRPTLIFDTYSYIHVPCDPDPAVSKSPLSPGSGWGTDFEFMFVDNVLPDQLGDTIRLVGLKNNATAYMVRATKDEKGLLDNGQYAANLNAINSKFLTYWQRFTIGTTVYELPAIDFTLKTIAINWLDGSGNLQTFRTLFWIDFNGNMIFVDPFVNGNVIIKGFTSSLNLIGTNVPASVAITPAIAPLKLDVNAAQNWYTQMGFNFNNCWVSAKAFHVNGVDDFCKFGAITNYQSLWYAGPSVFGGTSEGLITFTGSLAAPYCFSKVPFTVNAGIARFTLLSSSSTGFTGTGAVAVAMTSARNIMYGGATAGTSFQDWYFVPTSSTGKNYDMVRVSDALAWISWRPRS